MGLLRAALRLVVRDIDGTPTVVPAKAIEFTNGAVSDQGGGTARVVISTATRASLGLDTTDSPEFAALNIGAATDTTLARVSAGVLSVEGNRLFAVGGADVPVADGGTGASTAAGAATNLGLGTGDSPQFAGVNVGAATDTTITRAGAGDIAVEGNVLYRAGGTDVPIADGGTGASTKAAAFDALSPMTTQDDIVIGGASGTGTRLAKGSDAQVLTVDPVTHHLVWATPAASSGDVATDTIWDAKGDLAGGTGSNTAARLPVGSNGQVLTADSGETTGMKWAAATGGGAPDTAKYVTTAADATLSAEIVIPGLAAHPDVRVAAADDDEFDTTDTSDPMTGWTTLGTPTAHDINSSYPSHYYLRQNAASGTAWVGIYKTVPSIPFTVTAKISSAVLEADYNGAALFIGEAGGAGKLDLLEVAWAGTGRKIQLEAFTNRTTFSSGVSSASNDSAVFPVYLRIVVTSSSNVEYGFTGGPPFYKRLTSGRNPGFTVGIVGLAAKSENGSTDMRAIFDWIRFS